MTTDRDPRDDAGAEAERVREILDARARRLAAPVVSAARQAGLELATFEVAGERYGIAARLVREVVRLVDLARIPGAPDHVAGATNLRGEIVIVVDLRPLLALDDRGGGRRGLPDLSRLIVLGDERPPIAILADAARELVTIDAAAVREPPDAARLARTYLRGVTDDALIVLDGDVLLDDPRLYLGTDGVPGSGGAWNPR